MSCNRDFFLCKCHVARNCSRFANLRPKNFVQRGMFVKMSCGTTLFARFPLRQIRRKCRGTHIHCRGTREFSPETERVHELETEGLSAPPSVAGAQFGGAPDLRLGKDTAADGLRPLLLGRSVKRRGCPPLPPPPEPGTDG